MYTLDITMKAPINIRKILVTGLSTIIIGPRNPGVAVTIPYLP
jgi:hypothetical protein